MNSHREWHGLQVLEHRDQNPKRLALILHGYGANASDLLPLHRMIKMNKATHWIVPEAPLTLDFSWSRAWFHIDMLELQRAMQEGGHRDFSKSRPEGFDAALALLKDPLIKSQNEYEEIYIGGFSQGAMLATHLALELESIKFLMAFSSNLIDLSRTREIAEQRTNKLNFFQSHGRQDAVLSFESASDLYELIIKAGHRGEFVAFDGGHQIPDLCFHKLNSFLLQNERLA